MNRTLPFPVITDDRAPDEVDKTIGYVIATDRFLSGTSCEGRSLVACPVTSDEDCEVVYRAFRKKPEFLRVRRKGSTGSRDAAGRMDWTVRVQTIAGQKCLTTGFDVPVTLRRGDHLHIYNTQTSFRPEALRKQGA
jgi:hypothetical protein